MIYLMNSTMIPNPGEYSCEEISPEKFFETIRKHGNRMTSVIGYQQNLDFIEAQTGVKFDLSREKVYMMEGDHAFCMPLKYRVGAPADKGNPVDVADFEYFVITREL